jgi:hypothetical protein
MDEGRAELPANLAKPRPPVAIDRERSVAVAFGGIDRGIAGGVEDDVRARRATILRRLSGARRIDLRPLDKSTATPAGQSPRASSWPTSPTTRMLVS